MRNIFNRYLKNHESLKGHPKLRLLWRFFEDPSLWHLNRRSVSKAFAVGLFSAWVPSLGQMFLAAAGAIRFRAHLPVSVALVLITNPLTFAPMFYFAYRVGAAVLNRPLQFGLNRFDVDGFLPILAELWQPFLSGCLIVASVSAGLGYLVARACWRHTVVRKWKRRCAARKKQYAKPGF